MALFLWVNSLGFGFYDYSNKILLEIFILIAPYSNTVDVDPGPNVIFYLRHILMTASFQYMVFKN